MEIFCASPDKEVGLCEECMRNIDMFDVSQESEFSDFTPYAVKNFKTGIHFKCNGFKGKGKEDE